MPSFANTIMPTPFGVFDSDLTFQSDADNMVTFVKRALCDDVLTVELTRKQIWMSFERSCFEYSRIVNEFNIRSQLSSIMGMATGSVDLTMTNPKQTLEFLMKMAEPYGTLAGVHGSYDDIYCYLDLSVGKQDYNLYSDLKNLSGSSVVDSLPAGRKGKLRINDVFHFSPVVAQQFLLNASNITNFLATNFNYESYVNSTVFYVLPIFEDILRRGMLKEAFKVRRSNYSYEIVGRNIRILPVPTQYTRDLGAGRLFMRVSTPMDPMNPSYEDESIHGVAGAHNAPYSNVTYSSVGQPGKQWIREYTLALCTHILGLTRSKFQIIPIPNAELTLNGESLVANSRADKEKLEERLMEFLGDLTYDKLLEKDTIRAENLTRQLRCIPPPFGKAITKG